MWICSADWIDVRRLVLQLKPVIVASESLPFDSTATTSEQYKSPPNSDETGLDPERRAAAAAAGRSAPGSREELIREERRGRGRAGHDGIVGPASGAGRTGGAGRLGVDNCVCNIRGSLSPFGCRLVMFRPSAAFDLCRAFLEGTYPYYFAHLSRRPV